MEKIRHEWYYIRRRKCRRVKEIGNSFRSADLMRSFSDSLSGAPSSAWRKSDARENASRGEKTATLAPHARFRPNRFFDYFAAIQKIIIHGAFWRGSGETLRARQFLFRNFRSFHFVSTHAHTHKHWIQFHYCEIPTVIKQFPKTVWSRFWFYEWRLKFRLRRNVLITSREISFLLFFRIIF